MDIDALCDLYHQTNGFSSLMVHTGGRYSKIYFHHESDQLLETSSLSFKQSKQFIEDCSETLAFHMINVPCWKSESALLSRDHNT